jgi:hypothetical protein
MDTETRDRLDSIERKLDALMAGPAAPGEPPVNALAKSVLFWGVIVVVLAGIWALARGVGQP